MRRLIFDIETCGLGEQMVWMCITDQQVKNDRFIKRLRRLKNGLFKR